MHTYTQSISFVSVAKMFMGFDSMEKYTLSLPNAGLYGAGLSWIRISSFFNIFVPYYAMWFVTFKIYTVCVLSSNNMCNQFLSMQEVHLMV